jgi:hypothetical protein
MSKRISSVRSALPGARSASSSAEAAAGRVAPRVAVISQVASIADFFIAVGLLCRPSGTISNGDAERQSAIESVRCAIPAPGPTPIP